MNMIDFDTPTNGDDVENRLRRTFEAVASQTEVSPPSDVGFLPTLTGGRAETTDARSRSSWLLGAAASIAIAALGVVYFGQARQSTETTPATSQDEVSEAVDRDSTNGPATGSIDVEAVVGDDGVLHMLPPNQRAMTNGVDWQSGTGASIERGISRIAVGKPASNGFESVYAIVFTRSDGWFHYTESETQEVAGRTLMESYDEGVVERLSDGSFLVYQTEFGDPRLEELVAGTTVVDDRLSFEPAESDLEEVARVDGLGEVAASTLTHEPTDEPADDVEGDVPPFRLMTVTADDPTEAIAWAADFMFPSLRSITVNGRPGWVDTQGLPFGRVSIVAWSPVDGYVSVLIIDQPDDEAIVFAEQMTAVTKADLQATLAGTRATIETDGLLLLPADGAEYGSLEFSAPWDATSWGTESRMVIGESTPDGYTNLVAVFTSVYEDFNYDRELFPNVGTPVEGFGDRAVTVDIGGSPIERVGDGEATISWGLSLDDRRLETIINGTSWDDYQLSFDGGDSGFETVINLDDRGADVERAAVWHTASDSGDLPTFDLVTALKVSDDVEAIGHAVTDLFAETLRRTEVGAAQGWVGPVRHAGEEGVVVAWSPTAEHVAAVRVMGVSETEAIELAASLSNVEPETWLATMDENP